MFTKKKKSYLHGKKLKFFCFYSCLYLCFILFLFPGILFIIPFYFICFPFYFSFQANPYLLDSSTIHRKLSIAINAFYSCDFFFFFYIHTQESRLLAFDQIIIPLIETLQKLHALILWQIFFGRRYYGRLNLKPRTSEFLSRPRIMGHHLDISWGTLFS